MIAGGLFLLLIVVLVCGFGCEWLAEQKGYATSAALLVGLATGPLGLLIYAGAPDLIARRASRASGETSERTSRTASTSQTSGEREGADEGETSGEGEDASEPKRKPAKFEFPDDDWDKPSHRGPMGGAE